MQRSRLSVSLLLLLFHPASLMLLGWVESPGYPSGYSPHVSLNWSRCADKGHIISIRLIHLDLEDSQECENDALKIFSNRDLIFVLCGKMEFEELQSSVNPMLLSSPGGCLSLSFHSDYSNIKRHIGFRGFYSSQDFDECRDNPENRCTQFCHNFIGGYYCSCRHGYHLDTDDHTCTVSCTEDLSGLNRGVVSSPSWPASYAENANCLHTLSVEAHLQLELHFSEDFDIEQSPDGQCIDTLRIETPSGVLGPFCGHTPPPSPLLTHSSHVHIRFTSDGFGSNKGFTLHFQTRGKVCPAVVTAHSTATPQQPEYHQGQTVTVSCEPGYVMNIQSTRTLSSQFVTTCQRTGLWTPNYVCELVDCGFPDIPKDGILQIVGSDSLSTQYEDQIQLRCSSKYYQLEGDDTYTCNAEGEWMSNGGKTEMPKCTEVCGKPDKHPVSTARILGGQSANLGEIPWHLLIKGQEVGERRGGASLINDRWAVTAAHVVENIKETSLRLYGGLVDGRTTTNSEANVAVLDTERIIFHPNFVKGIGERTNHDNDIALIRFTSRVNLGPNLLPICLPEANMSLMENEQGTVSGWGLTNVRKALFVISPILKFAHIGVYSLTECQNTPSPSKNKQMIFTDNMFCAGAEGKDSCGQDSGGPFVSPMLAEGREPFYLTGIVSWGAPCQQRQYKGYYTKVTNYVDWIKETIEATELYSNIHWMRLLLLKPSASKLLLLTTIVKPVVVYCVTVLLYVSVGDCGPLPEPLMHGEVHSPGYPQPYPPNLQKQWDLSVPEGYQIRLTFTHLDIEASADCHYDALTVLHEDKVLGKFCGQENSANGHHPGTQPLIFPGNRLTLIFQTDEDNTEQHQNVGFSAHYQAIDIDECSAPEPGDGSGPLCSQICLNTLGSYLCSCYPGFELRSDQSTCVLSCSGGIFDEPEGHLFSPGYPNAPPHGVFCQYIISVEPGFTVSLNFTDNFNIDSVDTPQGPNCLYHWLKVTIPDREPRKLCGTQSPGLIHTNSSIVTLDYHTDDNGLSSGWSLDYNTNRVQCPFPGKVADGRVTPTLSEYLYRDYIFVRCDPGYKLMKDGQELKSFSAMCQSHGEWHLPLPECHIIDCGEPKPLLNGGLTFLSGSQNQYLSVVQYHCNEPFYSLLGDINAIYTCEADRKWRSNINIIISPTCIPVCGQPTKHISLYQRIIGGSEAPKNTIPWQVLLSVDGKRAGGMVIADRWIMTAAHVLIQNGNPASNEVVRTFMGLTNVKTLMSAPVFATSIHIHPDYNNPNLLDFSNDIALIKLQDTITFNASIMPVCLPAEDATYDNGAIGLVSGFGISDVGKRQILTNKLKYVQLPVVEQEICNSSITFAKSTKDRVPSLTNNMFCAGVPEGGKDSCQGDSGGPFVISDGGVFWAAGIVSWGVNCGQQGTYGVYTRVLNYLDWINRTMKEN
ncbi:ovochymase [Antennarius striatus]|uniref:ovochymase n=1 Tax=Antennarius striatus TaxID=241820 RepID=UPI0035B281F4